MTGTRPDERKRKRESGNQPVSLDRPAEKVRIKKAKLDAANKAADVLVVLERPTTPAVVDGSLRVMYLDVGQGDCALITTPGGKHIMIDCGSATKSPNIALTKNAATNKANTETANTARGIAVMHAVTGAEFLAGGKHLDILILTHSDLDHNNLVFTALTGITVGAVYHSGNFGNYQQKTKNYITGNIQKNPNDPNGNDQIKRVFCRWKNPADTTKGVDVKLGFFKNEPAYGVQANGDVIDILAPADKPDRLIIWRETNCTVTILAGDVEPGGTAETDKDGVSINDGVGVGVNKNTGSIVTLIEAFGKKYLFCGDATRTTERFLVAAHGDRIAGLDCLTVGHHGSSGTSSTPAFIAKTRPATVVISSGRQFSQYFHPRWAAARRYLQNFGSRGLTASGPYELICWVNKTGDEAAASPPKVGGSDPAVTAVIPVPDKADCHNVTVDQPIRKTPYTILVPPG